MSVPEEPVRRTGTGGVVISHRFTEKDQRLVRQLVTELEAAGIPCWYAPRDRRPTRDYGGDIAQAIRQAPALIVLLSPEVNDSDDVWTELALAKKYRIRITALMTSWFDLLSEIDYRVVGVQMDFRSEERASATAQLIEDLRPLVHDPVSGVREYAWTRDQNQTGRESAASTPAPARITPTHRLLAPPTWGALACGSGLRLVAGEDGAVAVRTMSSQDESAVVQRTLLGESITSLTLDRSGRGAIATVDDELRSATIRADGRLEWHSSRRQLPGATGELVALHQQGESWLLWVIIDGQLSRAAFTSLGPIENVVPVELDPHVEGLRQALGTAPQVMAPVDTARSGTTTHLFAGADCDSEGDVLRLVTWTADGVEQRSLRTGGPLEGVAVARAPAGHGKLGPVLAQVGSEILVWDWDQAEVDDGSS